MDGHKEMLIGCGKRIKEIRKARGLTVEQLAERLELSTSYIGLVERGCRVLSLRKMVEFCEFVKASLDYVVLGVEPVAQI